MRNFTLFSQACFVLVLADALLAYLSINLIGLNFPINAFVCLVFGVYVLFNLTKRHLFIPSPGVVLLLFLLALGFVTGFLNDYYSTGDRIKRILSCFLVFFVGYSAMFNTHSNHAVGRMFMVASGASILVSLVALLNIAPVYLPVINTVGYQGWVKVFRPEVITDQNFQVFYVFPIALSIFLLEKHTQKSIALLLWVAGVFVLVKLQTRSGFILMLLVMGGVSTVALKERLIRPFLFVLAVFCAILLVGLYLEEIFRVGETLINRFSKGDLHNLNGRLTSIYYLFDGILDPYTWWPQGLETYINTFGGLPHSNVTAVYLEGGLLSLIALTLIQILPIFKGINLYRKRRCTALLPVILIGAFVTIIASLSLCVPYYEHVYLWAGASWGVFNRALLMTGKDRKVKTL